MSPDLFKSLPIPKTETYLKSQLAVATKNCLKENLPQIRNNWKRPTDVGKAQFQQLMINKKFQEAYCSCEANIANYAGLIPSNLFPKSYREKAQRGLASQLKTHIKTPEGSEQVTYCFYHAWNRAAYALD